MLPTPMKDSFFIGFTSVVSEKRFENAPRREKYECLCAYLRYFSALCIRNRIEHARNERQKIFEPISRCAHNDYGNLKTRNSLLKGEVAVDRQEQIELLFGKRQQFTVLDSGPSHFGHGTYSVPRQLLREPAVNALVE
jgi:hypothetical protein